MPFTFAHPAAAVPLLGLLGRFGVLSALVIGSLAPDLSYFLPFSVSRHQSHSLLGLLWFCLPVGLFTYVLFHVLLKGPLLGLFPPVVLRRLGHYTTRFCSLPSVSWTAVVVSLLCGVLTHLVWDAFTHDDGPVVAAFPMFQAHLFSLGTYPVYVYKLLQHASTVVGLALLSVWSWRWLKNAPLGAYALPVVFSPVQRILMLVAIACIPAGVGLWASMQPSEALIGMSALQGFVGKAIFAALPAFGLTILMYSIGWHFWRLRGQSAG